MGLTGIDAVLPLRMVDYDRSEILRRSLKHFFRDLGTCWIVTPDHEFDAIRSRIHDTVYRVIPETEVIPELKFYHHAHRLFSPAHGRINGWFVQQLVKMAIAQNIESEFYLTLDADVICTRTVRSSDLVRDGRAMCVRVDSDVHREWYVWAERVLRLPSSRWWHGVTPTLLNKETMLKLHGYLAHRVNPAVRLLSRCLPGRSTLRSVLGSWRSYLLRNIPWTEYALYYSYLEAMNLFEKYYRDEATAALYGNCLWENEGVAAWRPEKSFCNGAAFFFSVVQSNSDMSAVDVWEKVRTYVQ